MSLELCLAVKEIRRLLAAGCSLGIAQAGARRFLCSQGFGLDHAETVSQEAATLV